MKATVHREEIRNIARFIHGNCCIKCGISNPIVLIFHHMGNKRLVTKKNFGIYPTPLVTEMSLDLYLSIYELDVKREDLILLCRNCHTIIHSR